MQKIKAKKLKISELSAFERRRLFEIMDAYYDGIDELTFFSDLDEKTGIFLLMDGENICGFSTYLDFEFKLGVKSVPGIFSGDTVLEKAYWGQKALGHAFLKHLLFRKLKTPFRPLYWFLMSKGFKTYLLMANNFSTHYPRHEEETPVEFKTAIDQVYGDRFGKKYDHRTGLVAPSALGCRLHTGVAPISDKLLERNQRVSFFQHMNPRWNRGFELACIAEMSVFLPFFYFLKHFPLVKKVRSYREAKSRKPVLEKS